MLTDKTLKEKGYAYELHEIKSLLSVTHVMKIERSKVDKFDLEIGKQPMETLTSLFNRTKADVIINGSFYDMKTGKSIAHAYNEKEKSGDQWLYSGWSIAKTIQDLIVIEQLKNTDRPKYKFILEGSPLLVKDGKVNIDSKGLSASIVDGKHPRTAIGLTKTHIFIVCVDGRTKISKGNTIKTLANTMFKLGCDIALNIDGGGSTRGLLFGKPFNIPTENRAVDNALCIWFKKEAKPMLPTYEVEVIAGKLNIRDIASTNGKAVGRYSKGDIVKVTQELGVWLKTDKGYIHGDYVKKKDNAITTKTIALDAGHGINTYPPSKGVPGLPEFEFNSATVKMAKELAEYNGFKVLLTQPLNGNDVALPSRTSLAINNKVDMLISFHADAADNNAARGNTVFYWNTSGNSKKLAEIWNKNAKELLSNPSRGIKESSSDSYNFHMVREPVTNKNHNFPAILCEHGFMTNSADFALLKSNYFRELCAVAAIKSACEYFGMEFKQPVKTATPPFSTLPTLEQNEIHVMVNSKLIGKGISLNGVTFAPNRLLADSLGLDIEWDGINRIVKFKSK